MANNIDTKKRKRNPNWDETEKTLLRECLKDVLNIIENKCTDTNTNKAKNLSWQKVMQCFNEVNIMERGLTELKQQWRTMKIDAKKCNSDYKKALKATGGGMKPPSPDPQTTEIMEMLPQEFEEDINQFDSDTLSQVRSVPLVPVIEILETIPLIDEVIKNDMISLIHSPPKTKEIDDDMPLVNQDSTTIIKKLPEFKKDLLGRRMQRKRKIDEVKIRESNSSDERNAAVISFMRVEHELKIKQMIEAHAWAQKEHNFKCENLMLQNSLLEKQLLN